MLVDQIACYRNVYHISFFTLEIKFLKLIPASPAAIPAPRVGAIGPAMGDVSMGPCGLMAAKPAGEAIGGPPKSPPKMLPMTPVPGPGANAPNIPGGRGGGGPPPPASPPAPPPPPPPGK